MFRGTVSRDTCMANIREQIRMLEVVNYTLSNYIDHNCSYDITGINVIHDELVRRIFQNNAYLENTFDNHDYLRTHGYNRVQSEYGLLIEKIKNKDISTKDTPQINFKALLR